MEISETENFAYDNLSWELQPQSPPLPLPTQESKSPIQQELTFPRLSKQDLLLSSLTLDEIRCKSGRSFGFMNIDEFVANILNTESHQLEFAQNQGAIMADQPTMPQQASISVPPPICKQTVDEIWSEIHKFQPSQQNDNLCKNVTLRQQQTLGHMTLEDFLVKAGVVQESAFPFKPASSPPPEPAEPFQNQNSNIGNSRPLQASCGLMSGIGSGFSGQQNVESSVSGNRLAVPSYRMFSQSECLVMREANTSSSGAIEIRQNLAESSKGVGGKRRIIDGPPEVVVERRQRRMLKNRESAARSRARRQAYTVELEAELSQLKQENQQLTQILAEAERTRKQEVAQRKHSTNSQRMKDKFSAIRRAASAAW